jgi:DNA polymerase-4/DNA polymerase V
LGLSVSIGVSLSKVLAKLGSKHRKPHGLTVIPGRDLHLFLENLPLEKVWGIGPNTTSFLAKLGVRTALEFARKNEDFVKKHLSKPYQEIWHELNGRSVYPVTTGSKTSYQSISKAKTFTPPSDNEAFVFAQLSKNLENACIKARRHRLSATRMILFLRRQDYSDTGVEIRLTSPSAYPSELMDSLGEGFGKLFRPATPYRQTGVVLSGLVPEDAVQHGLFDDRARIERMTRIYQAVDALSEKFGKHAVQLASSLPTKLQAQHEGERGDVPVRRGLLFKGESPRQRLKLPLLHIKV